MRSLANKMVEGLPEHFIMLLVTEIQLCLKFYLHLMRSAF